MNPTHLRSGALLASLLLALPAGLQAQQAPAAAAPGQASAGQAAKTFSQQELDQLLAPIALYPDPLIAQILMASTYPLEVVQAARWVKDNPKITGKALEDAMATQPWDPAVKALTTVPQVLNQMNDKLDWTQKLGDAFLAQQKDVLATVQALRAKADAAGNLKSTEQQVVKKEQQGSQTTYIIESPKPDVVYVPTYNPSVVYGPWWYPAAPPYYVYPPSYVYPPGVAFVTGALIGAAIWGNCNWGGGNVDVNVSRYNNFNRTNINNGNWNHNVNHRQGVAYRDQKVAQQYNRGGNAQATQSRDAFRGRAESGRAEMGSMDRGQLNDRAGAANRGMSGAGGSAQNRMAGGDRGGGGFSGMGNGAATHQASQRGGASRSSMGGGGGGGARAGGGGGGSRGGGGGGRGGGGRR